MLIFYIICTLTVTVNVEKITYILKKKYLGLLMKTRWLIDVSKNRSGWWEGGTFLLQSLGPG